MAKEKTHSEQTSAGPVIAGFEYQGYYFLYRLIKLEKGQEISFEFEDDVHITLADKKEVYIQQKHTVQKKADGSPINLSGLDNDLWHTLSNWSKVISDPNSGRESKEKQLEFVNNTEFHLVSNKSDTENNRFVVQLKTYTGNGDFDSLFTTLESLRTETKDAKLKQYFKDVLILNEEVLKLFLKKIIIILGFDDIIAKCKDAIESNKVPARWVDNVFRELDSRVRETQFIKIDKGEKNIISFSDFCDMFLETYNYYRNPELNEINISQLINCCHEQLKTTTNKLSHSKKYIPNITVGVSAVKDNARMFDNV